MEVLNNVISIKTEDLLLKKAKELGFLENNSLYYLKNLYIKNYKPILYVFNDKKFIKLRMEGNSINISMYNKSDIRTIKCDIDEDERYRLIIEFGDEVECFDGYNDTSDQYSSRFNEIIKDILIYLYK
ncbi:DUF3908 family protein [Clostridium sp. MSJ-8]|uniref:DUF3908 family protein n=1 Tax=Clostridium sp. MSJ-8 TaxID=2841510 RepID=UPI001C0EB01E|nr:DUF3908 family protein [Clostridium sp. MSJ-8]MBU5487864.1 DUF3908 family protein [Clostridium sp. MSJ-8]